MDHKASAAPIGAALEFTHAQTDQRPGSRWRLGMIGVAVLVPLAVFGLAVSWSRSTVKPVVQPLDGAWSCSLDGKSVGTLSVTGENYVLGDTGGTLDLVVYPTKYHEKIIKVRSGPLVETFGAKLGFHYHVPLKPDMVVFNIGPASGIRCSRP